MNELIISKDQEARVYKLIDELAGIFATTQPAAIAVIASAPKLDDPDAGIFSLSSNIGDNASTMVAAFMAVVANNPLGANTASIADVN